jgi:hypothetical protein
VLTTHKNALHADVARAGLPHGLFELDEPDPRHLIIKLRESNLYFEIRYREGSFDKFQCRFVPFGPGVRRATAAYLTEPRSPIDRTRVPIAAGADGWIPNYNTWAFTKIQQQFQLWLERDVKRAMNEMTTVDLWNSATLSEAVSNVPNVDNTRPFSEVEQQQIRVAVDEFASMLESELDPTDEEMSDIRERLAYLSDAVERLNRFDWRALALSTVLGIGTTMTVDTATGRRLWDLFARAFHAVGHLLAQ